MPLAGTSESATAPAAQSATDLVATYLPLVGHLVREASAFLPAHLTATDLVPAGLHALADSARRHCATTTATPFAQAAIADIRAALATAVHARGSDGTARPATVRDALVDVLGREPRQDEVARTIGLRAPRSSNVRALPQPARPDRTADVRTAMERLPEQLRVIVAELYLNQRRVAEVAAELDLPETEVARLRSLALAELGALMASGAVAAALPAAGSAALASRAAVAAHAPAAWNDRSAAARLRVRA